jgi:hypothetical protein
MNQRLFLIAVVAILLLTAILPGLPALSANAGGADRGLGVAYVDDISPTPTATPPTPDGSCHGSGQCGD